LVPAGIFTRAGERACPPTLLGWHRPESPTPATGATSHPEHTSQTLRLAGS
jgi:hypothetical protein